MGRRVIPMPFRIFCMEKGRSLMKYATSCRRSWGEKLRMAWTPRRGYWLGSRYQTPGEIAYPWPPAEFNRRLGFD